MDRKTIDLNVDKQIALLDILTTLSLERLRKSLHMIHMHISVDEGMLGLVRSFVREVSTDDSPGKALNRVEMELIVEFFKRLDEYEPQTAYSIHNYIPYDFALHRGIAHVMRNHLLVTKNIVEHVPDALVSWPLTEQKKTILLELIELYNRNRKMSKQIIKLLDEEPYSPWEEELTYYFGKYFAPLNWFTLQCDFVLTISAWRDIMVLLEQSDSNTWITWLEFTVILEADEIPDMSFGGVSSLLKAIRL